MFGLPIDEITFEDVDAFCRSGVREGVLLDFKKDFPARLEKTVAAFANTFGGMILIGVDETKLGEPVVPICGIPLSAGLRERVIQIGLDGIFPPVIPEVKVVDFKSPNDLSASDRAVLVIRVRESESGAHAVDKRTTVYLRVDNVSDPFRKTTLEELEWFINNRQKALHEKNRILELVRGHADRHLRRLRTRRNMTSEQPRARCVWWTAPRFPRQPLASPRELLNAPYEFRFELENHKQLFPLGSVLPVREGVFFDGEYDSRYRYTEIQQQGMLYHEWGFWWDGNEQWRQIVFASSVVELLVAGLHCASLLYSKFGYWGLIEIQFSLVGVDGRGFYDPLPTTYPRTNKATEDVITTTEFTSVPELAADGIELARRMMLELAWAFGDLDLPPSVDRILAKAQSDQFLQAPRRL
jgi:hypothetical protein